MQQYYIDNQVDFLLQTFLNKNFNSSAAWRWEMSQICVKMFSE